MSSSTLLETPLIEKIRANHEEIERLEESVMKVLETEPLSPTKQLLQGHRLRSLINSVILKTEELVETYAAFTDEDENLIHQTETWANVSSDFSYRLEQINEYYEKYPSKLLFKADDEGYESLLNEEPVIAFSEEEGFGRYLDLHAMYNQYINSNFGERIEYSTYLDVFSQPEKIPSKLKLSRQYTEYIEALLEYLISFFQRTEPLQDLDIILSKVEDDFKDGKVEARVKKLCNLLDETIERTKQKKQALAYEEDKQETMTGWDEKPIPYLLSKLGLALDYKCEICENYSYAGKKGFERHFKEWRHYGKLHRLGISDIEQKKFYGITSIEEVKEVWMKMKGKPLVIPPHWQSKKEALAPVGVAIPPSNLRKTIERIALIDSRKGLEHEKTILDIWGEDEELNFLKSVDDPYHAFYQHKLSEFRAGKNQDITTGRSYFDEDEEISRVPVLHFEAHMFTCRVPKEMMITQKEIEIIKLNAEFWVRFGDKSYLEGLSSDHHREVEFMNNKSDGKFHIFSQLVSAYGDVIRRRPEIVKEKLRENAFDIETVLENCYQRLQLHRFYEEKTPVLQNRYYQRLRSNRLCLDKYWARKSQEEARAKPPRGPRPFHV